MSAHAISTDDPTRAPIGDSAFEVTTFSGGVGLISGASGWFLADEAPARSLGRALVWADRSGVEDLNIVVDADGDIVARRAAEFERPPRVLRVEGDSLVTAEVVETPPPTSPPVEALDLVPLLARAGIEIVVENGIVRGEILGLEVARVVVGTGGVARVEVGVGHHDREAFAMVHGDVPTPEALAAVVESVRRHRRAGADRDLPEHPLGRMAAERWLRSVIVDQPGRVGAARLDPVEPTVERRRVDEVVPAVAVGVEESGAPVVVVCSTGIDLDLVPTAADARAVHSRDARLIIVVPERDAHPVTHRLAGALRRPATVVTVPPHWRSWS